MKYNEVRQYLKELSSFLNSRDSMEEIKITQVVNPDDVPSIGDITDDNKHAIPYIHQVRAYLKHQAFISLFREMVRFYILVKRQKEMQEIVFGII